MINIGYISPTNPFVDKKGWSGTYYNVREALELAGHKVEWIQYDSNSLFLKIFNKIYKLIYGNGSFTHSRLSSWLKVNSIHTQLENYDLIFVPGQIDVVAGLKTQKPIIYYTDGTVPLMIDYYWFNFTKRAIDEAEKLELKAVKNASINIYASNWARSSAIKEYKINKSKTEVLPFGANLAYEDTDNISSMDKNSGEGIINIIFSGVDWKRKGGEIAVNACKKLIDDGYDVKLTIVGIKNLDDKIVNLNFVDYMGFLDKEDEEQYQKYLNAWRQADILLLPTRAECAGIVFNEASAFGVPSLSVDTGGVADYVRNDINGYRMPISANSEDFALKMEEWIRESKLNDLSKGAKAMYRARNSWSAWGNSFNRLLEDNNLLK